MCGIAGYFGYEDLPVQQLEQTLSLMKNRGPDHRDKIHINDDGRHIHFLHSRLAIIDLDARSHQPFTIGESTIVFNGEIYNYLELRQRLESHGIAFRTTSDTEVLLQAYLHFGDSCVDHFEGMWSFAIYDRREGKLFLSRDRFGEKPLYYTKNEHGFFFGSEIKLLGSLLGSKLIVNEQHLYRYLVNGYKSLYKVNETYYHGVQLLPQGSNLILKRGYEQPEIQRYWAPNYQPKVMTLEQAIEGTKYHLLESVRLRLRADVPLAFCLSGGVDSGAIASIAAKKFNCKVAAFSIIDSDERYNELNNIMATVQDLGCQNTLVPLNSESNLDGLRKLIGYHDAPLATISYYVHSFLSEAVAASGYKVVFSGTGADEIFTGYYDHFNLYLYEMRKHPQYRQILQQWRDGVGKVVRNPYLQDPEIYLKNSSFRDHIYLNNDDFATYLNRDFSEQFFEENYCQSLLRNRMFNEMFHEVTPVILNEDDLNSMYYSIENRSPFLDSKLYDFINTVPDQYLIQEGQGKYLLRQAMAGILNDTVRLDKQKKGFNASIHSVFDFSASGIKDHLLDDGPVFKIFNKNKVERLLTAPYLSNSYSKFLFNFINTRLFLEQAG